MRLESLVLILLGAFAARGVAGKGIPGNIVVKYAPPPGSTDLPPQAAAQAALAVFGLRAAGGASNSPACAGGGGRDHSTGDKKAASASVGVYTFTSSSSVDDMLTQLKGIPGVVYAEPLYRVQAQQLTRMPNDPKLSQMWWVSSIRADAAWAVTTGSSAMKVCVIDTGVQSGHEDMLNVVTGWSRVPSDSPPIYPDVGDASYADFNDVDGHGTHVTGVVGAAGNNGKGVAGINWQVSIAACRALDGQGKGDTWSLKLCIDDCRQWGAKVITASLGGAGFNQAVYEALVEAEAAGILFTASAGNSDSDQDLQAANARNYPAAFGTSSSAFNKTDLANVLSVAAIDKTGGIDTAYSNYGKTTVHLAAPGSCIYGPGLPSSTSYSALFGTSLSTPMVAGSAALIWQAALSAGLSVTYADVRAALLSGVDPCMQTLPPYIDFTNFTISGGRLNLYRSLQLLLSASPIDPPPITGTVKATPGKYINWAAECTGYILNGNVPSRQACVDACVARLDCKLYQYDPAFAPNCALLTETATLSNTVNIATSEYGYVIRGSEPPSPPSPPPSPPPPPSPSPRPSPPPSPVPSPLPSPVPLPVLPSSPSPMSLASPSPRPSPQPSPGRSPLPDPQPSPLPGTIVEQGQPGSRRQSPTAKLRPSPSPAILSFRKPAKLKLISTSATKTSASVRAQLPSGVKQFSATCTAPARSSASGGVLSVRLKKLKANRAYRCTITAVDALNKKATLVVRVKTKK